MGTPPRRLTSFANCAGCAGKISLTAISELLKLLPPRPADPNLIVGTETADDAGVYRIGENLALVQTVDFFPPLLDDPFAFGQVAAANALSDVYAMNGRPLTALNLVGFPYDDLPMSVLAEILRGAADRVTLAGAVTLGGHSIRDNEVKFGLSVTGLVEPSAVLTNAGARVGDVLVLTKPLGTGFLTTAAKNEACPAEVLDNAIASMIQLNAVGRDALNAAGGAHALTDVTGYGLAGHASEMAQGSGLTLVLDTHALPILEGAEALATPKNQSRAFGTNRDFLADRVEIRPTARPLGVDFCHDPQTSGGLLIAIDPAHVDRLLVELRERRAKASAVIGRVEARRGSIAVVLS